MTTSRFVVLAALLSILWTQSSAYSAQDRTPIDRQALVSRHDVVVHAFSPDGAMAIGNGEFAFNFDATGLQTFPAYYEKTMPLGILSTWGWHNFPNPNHYSLDDFPMKTIAKHDRQFIFPAASTSSPTPEAAYLRENPHRFGLAQIGLVLTHADGSLATVENITHIDQHLFLWDGHVVSQFEFDGQPVEVVTAAHPTRDEIAVRVDSPLVASGHLKLRLAFPYASKSFGPDYQDWSQPAAHVTRVTRHGETSADFDRTMDDVLYHARVQWSQGATLDRTAAHDYRITGAGNQLELTTWFSPAAINEPADSVAATLAAAGGFWHGYWSTGGAIDLSGNTDPRAAELERRIVLSQYVLAVHDSGPYPPAETGLGVNSWYGKFHMEMYWWHAAHWALWGHADILERSLDHLTDLMPPGEAMAKREGCIGVKWSKMTDPSGNESPSGVGPVLVWQQPHPIYLAELVYRDKKDRVTLDQYKRIVFETADYMASFVDYDPARKEYVLGPGVSSGDEKHTDIEHNLNPTMELGYWKWALETAQHWHERLGEPRNPKWDDVIDHLAKPVVRNGVYPALEFPQEDKAAFMATFLLGALPGEGIDRDAMRKTLAQAGPKGKLNAVTWGTGMAAMCAARLNEPEEAVRLLAGDYDTNPFRASGYTVRRPDQTPMYMPANGAWLSAAAMMAAGWDGNTEANPGFPKNWTVRWEGLAPMP